MGAGHSIAHVHVCTVDFMARTRARYSFSIIIIVVCFYNIRFILLYIFSQLLIQLHTYLYRYSVVST